MRQGLHGQGASRGSALGRARVREPHALEVAEARVAPAEAEAELARLHAAIEQVRGEIRAMRDQLHGALAHEVGEFLDLHTLLLEDPELLHGLDELVRSGLYGADYALRLQRDRLAAVFEGMDDAYFRSRIEDIDHVIGRVHAALHDHEAELQGVAGEILVTDAIAPSEIGRLHAQGVLGIVTSGGSMLSHTAILARSLHLPLIVNAPQALGAINDGDVLVIDGSTGEIVIEPGPSDLRVYRARLREEKRERKQLRRLRREPSKTLDGVDIRLYANAESREDVAEAHALGAAGIGLYRTEFLFLQGREVPDEDAQFRAYRDLVLGMTGRTVTIRTLDIGADKADNSGLALRNEPNPALGLRGVRLSMARTGLLETQLRAIARASGYGPVRILVPMVSGREEVIAVRQLLTRVLKDLAREGQETAAQIALGAMIEVPSAAIALPTFARDLDFISIGTNDLVQYLLATDRNNDALGDLYSPLHPAVLRLVHSVVRVARARGMPASICGEIAGDARFTPLLLALGIEELSLHPSPLLEVRRAIRALDLGHLRARAPALLRARDRAGIERWLDAVQPVHAAD
ncbi:phosphoenolpyruvate--protein phosphotransferase [Luteimonas fraxinea]|uniref:Phosphoenolpyruvate-protein phosphotransferase n=1 Tax=Luteimonas fraxinea TaxID=2901869 RepID=A0ABS8UEJ5_9GAMM|nr:phosphoenolpyruvate--protein phosphotransferase [Luteimonas fraxinea]MCD9097917.1 phosphoenolpyruvate--protein phosphotransferase [Luteimonas fraxinea]UHH09348.1 phosphoenolpyruvate--protein phosphotransferase [Luteimonas fraxinea]